MTKTESLEDNPDISPGFPLPTHLHRYKMYAYRHKCITYTRHGQRKIHPTTKGLLTCRSQGRVCILDAWCSYLGGSNCSLKRLNKANVQSSHPVKEDSGRQHVLSVSGWRLCPPSSLALFLSKQVPPNFFLPSYWPVGSLLTVRAARFHRIQKVSSTDPMCACVWISRDPCSLTSSLSLEHINYFMVLSNHPSDSKE